MESAGAWSGLHNFELHYGNFQSFQHFQPFVSKSPMNPTTLPPLTPRHTRERVWLKALILCNTRAFNGAETSVDGHQIPPCTAWDVEKITME